MTKASDYFSQTDIQNMEQRHRAAFINSLGGFKSVNLVGTKNNAGQTNLAIFNSIVHIGANPPLIGLVVRPDSAERHTLENILETSFYTLNHLNEDIYDKAHQTSARYPRAVSEFEAVRLTPSYQNDFFAPFVKESYIQIGVKLREKIDFNINGTTFLIGEIQQVYFPSDSLQTDGFLDLEMAHSITCSGLDSYHRAQKIGRLSYAKPDKWPKKLG